MTRKSRQQKLSNTNPAGATHPGHYVREKVLVPAKMSVTKAAENIGVSRPNVSNFLNGKSSLTAEMASRIERAFNIPAQTLLDMQAAYDASQAKEKGTPSNARMYVPPFLAIKANAIEQWVDGNIEARIRLSVFLRKLVNSTGHGLTKVDFPGNDSAELPGWDGYTEATEGTPWVPVGITGWEFGTNNQIKTKADGDFAKSVKAYDKDARQSERLNTTFIFVTPRRWPGKKVWEKEKNDLKLWKEVRAYDSDTLEQWLEQSLPGQAWFANETNIPANHVRSLDKSWDDWAEITSPPLVGTLFNAALETAKSKATAWLSKPATQPFIITADSAEEAVAFVSYLFSSESDEKLAAERDRVIVFDKKGILPRLMQGAQTFIPVVYTRDVERELAPYSSKIHSIVICPRNSSNADPDIVIEPTPYETFKQGLEEMGKNRDEISQLDNATGRSLTVLRRRLSNTPSVKTPEWAADKKIAESLVPFLFIGAWNSANETDREAMSLLANKPYEELERICQQLTQLNDAPVWSVGAFRGVVSKMDLLFAIEASITKDDLDRYYSFAQMVLGEDDPTLDLSEDQRWAAAIHGKVRKFSTAFRKGISETLVLLAVHGNKLFKHRKDIDTEVEASKMVRHLLPAPLKTRDLEMNNSDLPVYAEAAPETFLSIIEKDLQSNEPAALNLLRPVDSGIFGSSPSRTGLLWALESLAWNPETLTRVALILARLSEIEINDNWVNKPINSLKSIFRSWMPQTAANHDQRISVIKILFNRYPHVAWRLCVSQFGRGGEVGDYNHKPQWRTDAYGFGEPFSTVGPAHQFIREMVEMALSRESYDLGMISDLVSRLDALSDTHQMQVWELITTWAKSASDADKALLREKLRTTCLSRRAAKRAKKNNSTTALSQKARDVYLALEPSDLLNKHAWLFQNGWVDESYDEIHDDDELDYQKRDERITQQRAEALREVYKKLGIKGIIALANQGKAAFQIGAIVATHVLDKEPLVTLLREALSAILVQQDDVYFLKQLVGGAFRFTAEDKRESLVSAISETLTDEEKVQLLLLCQFNSKTWQLVSRLSAPAQEKYWNDVAPDWIISSNSDSEAIEAVNKLLKVNRPRAAFACIAFHPEKLQPKLLFDLLSTIAKGGKDQPGHYQLEEYHIQKAFEHINASNDLTLEQKAGLEFAYLDVLAKKWDDNAPGIPNLERYVEMQPELFVQAVVWAYKRGDDGIDPPEYRVEADQIEARARNSYKLMDGIERIPGHNPRGELEAPRLAKWIKTVRDACKKLGRADIAEIRIGNILASAPLGTDGVWPCEPVREVLEELHSEHIMRGVCTGRYNLRGVHWRGEGGDQERELANQYRQWAQALHFTFPYVSSQLLMEMAKTYESEADQEDTHAGIQRRLH